MHEMDLVTLMIVSLLCSNNKNARIFIQAFLFNTSILGVLCFSLSPLAFILYPSLEGFCYLHLLECLDKVSFVQIVVIGNVQTAFVTLGHLLDVILEAFQ
jgi:hypothetical protein